MVNAAVRTNKTDPQFVVLRWAKSVYDMATFATKQSILKLYPHLRKSIQQVQQDVLGYAPPSMNNFRTGLQASKKQLTAVYLNQYYDANPSIDPYVRQVSREKCSSFTIVLAED